MPDKKVGFIYLDELHHIHHFLSPAIELSKESGYDVDILTFEAQHEYLIELVNKYGGTNLKIIQLNTFLYRRVLEKIKKRSQPSALYIYKKHMAKLLQYDALVFTDHTANLLHSSRKNSVTPKLIHIAHGSGDGLYGYQETHKIYDLIIVAGNKKMARLKKDWPKEKMNIKICGYSKFDLTYKNNKASLSFTNSKPIVLYAPHFKKELSSWYLCGTLILDYFLNQSDFNLIFAPHINLFNKKGFENPLSLDPKYNKASNIHVDIGSTKSIDMAYTNISDVYLGDVSSQAYEFMYKTRPLIFLNAHNIKWKNNKSYLFWNAGQVIKSVEELAPTLKNSMDWSEKFKKIQQQLFNDTYDLNNEKSGSRIAKAIIKEVG